MGKTQLMMIQVLIMFWLRNLVLIVMLTLLLFQSDGEILVEWDFSSYNGSTANRIIRLNSDGNNDSSFEIGNDSVNGFNSIVSTVTIQEDGKILVGGNFTTYSGKTANRTIRLNSNGSIGTSFVDSGINNNVLSIAYYYGKILVGGNFNFKTYVESIAN